MGAAVASRKTSGGQGDERGDARHDRQARGPGDPAEPPAPDHTRTVATLKMSEEAVSICTIVSGPERSAMAWIANPLNSPTMPISRHGRRLSRRSRDGRPAGHASGWPAAGLVLAAQGGTGAVERRGDQGRQDRMH